MIRYMIGYVMVHTWYDIYIYMIHDMIYMIWYGKMYYMIFGMYDK